MSKHGAVKKAPANQDNQDRPRVNIPTLCVTSEDDCSTPLSDNDLNINMLQQQHNYNRDEDTTSMAPLLDSGATTPVGEEPQIPLTLGSFLASANSARLRGRDNEVMGEEIMLPSLDEDNPDESDDSTSPHMSLNPHWAWIRRAVFFAVISAILGCFGTSVTMIVNLPARCDPSNEWWQGRLFYEIFPARFCDSNGDGVGDIAGITSKLDYLQQVLHVDVVKLDSIFTASDYPEHYLQITDAVQLDPRLGNASEWNVLITALHQRNMSCVIDVHVDHLPGVEKTILTDSGAAAVESVLLFWMHRGVDGFYLKGLEGYAQQVDLWRFFLRWRNACDNMSGTSRKILIAGSNVLQMYLESQGSERSGTLQDQLDLVDAYVSVERVSGLQEQILRALRWDDQVGKPWIMWSAGGELRSRMQNLAHATHCQWNAGALMFLLSLPGSASVFYGDEIGLRNNVNNATILQPMSPMQWSDPAPDHCPDSATVLHQLGQATAVRRDAVPLHTNAIIRQLRDTQSRTHNYQYFVLANKTVVVERYYPRRHRYLTISNLGTESVVHDLSRSYYGGQTLVSSTATKSGYIQLDRLHLEAGEGLLLLLDK